MASIQQFLQQQEREYRKHQRIVETTETTIQHQNQIRAKKEIPKKHRPKPPTIINSEQSKKKFDQSFQEEYSKLFLRILEEAISQNTITAELEKARCLEIIIRTEKELCTSLEPPILILRWYTDFLQRLNLTDHEMSPELRVKLHHSETTPSAPSFSLKPKPTPKKNKRPYQSKRKSNRDTPTFGQKRKSSSQEPKPMKQMKLDHFLAKGQRHTTKPI